MSELLALGGSCRDLKIKLSSVAVVRVSWFPAKRSDKESEALWGMGTGGWAPWSTFHDQRRFLASAGTTGTMHRPWHVPDRRGQKEQQKYPLFEDPKVEPC